LSVPRYVHERSLASENLADKIMRVEMRYSSAGSIKSISSASGKRKTLVVKRPQKKKIIACSGDSDQSSKSPSPSHSDVFIGSSVPPLELSYPVAQ
jgi:hypothetical protein